jgi:hypothetical protein
VLVQVPVDVRWVLWWRLFVVCFRDARHSRSYAILAQKPCGCSSRCLWECLWMSGGQEVVCLLNLRILWLLDGEWNERALSHSDVQSGSHLQGSWTLCKTSCRWLEDHLHQSSAHGRQPACSCLAYNTLLLLLQLPVCNDSTSDHALSHSCVQSSSHLQGSWTLCKASCRCLEIYMNHSSARGINPSAAALPTTHCCCCCNFLCAQSRTISAE